MFEARIREIQTKNMKKDFEKYLSFGESSKKSCLKMSSLNVVQLAMLVEKDELAVDYAAVVTLVYPKREDSGCIKIEKVTPVCVCGYLWKDVHFEA